MAARKIGCADPSLRYTSVLLGRLSNQPTNCLSVGQLVGFKSAAMNDSVAMLTLQDAVVSSSFAYNRRTSR